jgi:hypothetical protein
LVVRAVPNVRAIDRVQALVHVAYHGARDLKLYGWLHGQVHGSPAICRFGRYFREAVL